MLSYVSMRPLPREFTPGGFLRRDAAQRFVGRPADDAFWGDLFNANWIEAYELIATHDLVIGEDGVVRLEPATRGRPTDRHGDHG